MRFLQEMGQRLPDDARFCLADALYRVDDGEEQHQADGAVRAGLVHYNDQSDVVRLLDAVAELGG